MDECGLKSSVHRVIKDRKGKRTMRIQRGKRYAERKRTAPGETSKRKGVLTVEAAIILPVFLMVMVFVLSILKLFYFHLVMQQALQNVGTTLAQYGYVIDKVIDLETFSLKEETKEAEENLVTSVNDFFTTGSELALLVTDKISLDEIGEIISKGQELGNNAEAVLTAAKAAANKETIVNYLLVSAMNGAGGLFVDWMTKDYLDAMEAKNETLENFKYAFYVEAGTKDFLLVAEYDYTLPLFVTKPIRIQQAVRVHPWVGGETEGIYQGWFE